MKVQTKKACLIIDLGYGDTGFVKYSASVLDHLQGDRYICFQSKHRGIRPSSFPGRIFFVNAYLGMKDIMPKTAFVLPYWLLFSLILIVTGKVDKVYFPYFNHWNIFFAKIFQLFQLPIIYTAHDGKMHLGEKRVFTQMMLDWMVSISTHIIFLSASVQNEIRDQLKHQIRFIIPHGIFTISGVLELKEIRPRPRILFIGRISRYKGVEMLVDAIQQLQEDEYEKLTIAGKSNYNLEIPSHRKIELIDKWLTEDEIANLINQSDIMVFPYIEATQSGAVTLAVHGLRPIVHTQVGGIVEQLSPSEAISVPPNTTSLRDGLRTLILNTELRKDMLSHLKRRKTAHSWATIATSIETVLSSTHRIKN